MAGCNRFTATPARASRLPAPLSGSDSSADSMYGLNVGMIVAGGQALGVRQCLLELGGKFVESHSGRLAC